MPSSWLVSLSGPPEPQIPLEAPHAVVSRWLDLIHKAPAKAYALSPPGHDRGRTILTVRLLDDALAGSLTRHIVVGERVRLGRHWFTVTEPPVLAGGTAWTSLGRSGRRAWELTFNSPTAFRRRNRTSPFPAPPSVITSLLERWWIIDPPTAPPFTAVDLARSLWVSDLDGHSSVMPLRDTIVSGFTGRIRYVCDGTDAQAEAVDALLSFAEYAGVGSHTAYGLGTVSLGTTWAPGTRSRAPESPVDAPGEEYPTPAVGG